MSPLQRMAGGWASISLIKRIIVGLVIGIAMCGAAAADVGPSEAPASEREGE